MERSEKKHSICNWFEHYDGFSDVEYWTTCDGTPTKLLGAKNDVARAVWAVEASYCPFCGSDICYCDESEINADIAAEREYREGIRYGTMGYGG